jgi:hypothetical protein
MNIINQKFNFPTPRRFIHWYNNVKIPVNAMFTYQKSVFHQKVLKYNNVRECI